MFEVTSVFTTVWPGVNALTIVNIVLEAAFVLDPARIAVLALTVLFVKFIFAGIFGAVRPALCSSA